MLGCCQVLWEEMVTTSGRVVYVAEIYKVFCRLLQVVHSNLFGTYFWNISTSTLPTFTRSSKIVSIVSTFLCLVGNSIPCSGSIYWGGQKLFLLVVITEQTQNLGAVQHIKHSNLILYVCKTGSGFSENCVESMFSMLLCILPPYLRLWPDPIDIITSLPL